MDNWNIARALFVSPSAAFVELRERPRFWFPLLLTLAAALLVLVWYYWIVDFAWLKEHLLSTNPRVAQLPELERARIAGRMSKTFMLGSSVVGATVVVLGVTVICAACYSLAASIVHLQYSFKHWLALTCWASLPQVVASAASMAALLLSLSDTQITAEEIKVLSLNALFFHRSANEPGFLLLSTLTLVHPWTWWLTAVGVRTWSGRSWVFSWIFALLPSLIVYVPWATIVFLR